MKCWKSRQLNHSEYVWEYVSICDNVKDGDSMYPNAEEDL